MEERPPVVWLPSLGHGAHLLAWLLRDDGEWWAHLHVTALIPDTGFGRKDTFYEWSMTAHASLVEQRTGWDYTRVPKRRA